MRMLNISNEKREMPPLEWKTKRPQAKYTLL